MATAWDEYDQIAVDAAKFEDSSLDWKRGIDGMTDPEEKAHWVALLEKRHEFRDRLNAATRALLSDAGTEFHDRTNDLARRVWELLILVQNAPAEPADKRQALIDEFREAADEVRRWGIAVAGSRKRKTLQEIQEAENRQAAVDAKARDEREREINERRARTARLEGKWPLLSAPHPMIADGRFDWTGWYTAISIFCDQVAAEGQTAKLIDNIRGLLNLKTAIGFSPADEDLLSLLLAGLTEGSKGIEIRMAELANADRKGWATSFRHDGWLDLIQYPDLERREKLAMATTESKSEPEPNGLRAGDFAAERAPEPVSGGLVIALSGGGLRATLFHLGIFVLLAHTNRLRTVKEIVSVSGGSILAAHFSKDWQTATKDAAGFTAVAAALVGFARSDLRNAVLIPWLWSRLLPCWWVRCLGRTARLRRAYTKHFGQTTMGNLASPNCPRIAIVATDAIRRERVAFTANHIVRSPLDSTDGPNGSSMPVNILSQGVELSLAVAASSCFPPVFRRMFLDHRDLGLNYGEFKETLALNDGGVAGNLGIEVLLALRNSGWGAGEMTLIADAECPQITKPKDFVLTDVGTQGVALSRGAKERMKLELGTKCAFIHLSDRTQEPNGLTFRTQTGLAGFRTDLDAPSWQEIHALMLHGAVVAAEVTGTASTKGSLEQIRERILEIIKVAGGPDNLEKPTEADLRTSRRCPAMKLALHTCAVAAIAAVAILWTAAYLVCRALDGFHPDVVKVASDDDHPVIAAPSFDFPSLEIAGVKPLTDEDMSNINYADARVLIRNETSKNLKLAFAYKPYRGSNPHIRASPYVQRESQEIPAGLTMEHRRENFGGPVHVSIFADRKWTATNEWLDLRVVPLRTLVVTEKDGSFDCRVEFEEDTE